MKKRALLVLFSLIVINTQAQDLYRSEYPEGQYATKENFIAKTPSSNLEIYPAGSVRMEYALEDSLVNEVFFWYKSNNAKVKKTFAISYKGFLYFQNGQIIKAINRNKADKDQTTHDTNAFVRVRQGGDNFLYTETELHSAWKAGVAYNLGAAGASMAADLGRFKGVVWDKKKQEFNIFRNCKDLNVFLWKLIPEEMQECTSKKYDVLAVREIIRKIK